MQAARWGGYQIDEFFRLDHEWMEFIIAGYRIERQIEAVMQDEQNKKAKANKPKSGGSGGRSSPRKSGRKGRSR